MLYLVYVYRLISYINYVVWGILIYDNSYKLNKTTAGLEFSFFVILRNV